MDQLQPRLDILPALQRKVWNELGEIPSDFILYRGTAIALHLGHRESIDFDFFGWRNFAPLDFAASLSLLDGGIVLQSEPDTLTVSIDRGGPVKLSFFGVPRLKKIKPPLFAQNGGLRIASLLDLAATKLVAIQQRVEPKDYIDLAAIMSTRFVSLPEALSAAQHVYGPLFSPQNALKALSFFGEDELQQLPESLKQNIVSKVKAVDLSKLPKLEVT